MWAIQRPTEKVVKIVASFWLPSMALTVKVQKARPYFDQVPYHTSLY